MLVIDLHALEAVDLLNLVDQILGELFHAEHAQDVVRRAVAVHQGVALAHHVPFLDADVLALGNEVLHRLGVPALVVGHDHDPPLRLVVLTELDPAVDIGDDRVVLRLARLEQLGDPRQAAGDVAGLGRPRDAGEHGTGLNLLVILDVQDGIDREGVLRLATVGQRDDLAVVVHQTHPRLQVATARLLDHDLVGDPRPLVHLLAEGEALHHVGQAGGTRAFRDHRQGERIPGGDDLPPFDDLVVLDVEFRAIGNATGRAFPAVVVAQHDLEIAAHHHRRAGAVVPRHVFVRDGDRRVVLGLDARLLRLGGAADMERAHRKLRARLANRLRRDDADRLADVGQGPTRKVTPVAQAAHAVLALAGKNGADPDRFHVGLLDALGSALVDHGPGLDDGFAGHRIPDRLGGDAPQDAIAQGGGGLPAFEHILGHEAAVGAAILLDDDAVLGHVDEAAGEIARIRGLERRVGEALARAMRRVEVLEHGEPLLEVRDDRRLDDLARGLGHQAAHPGELLHLRLRATGAGIGHDADRVELLHPLPHGRRHLFSALRPSVDHLVVSLALRDQAVRVLALALPNQLVGLGNVPGLLTRHHHVVLADGDASQRGVTKPEVHHLVGEDHRLLLPAVAVDVIENGGELALGERFVDRIERDVGVFRQRLGEDQAPGGRLRPRGLGAVGVGQAAFNHRVQRHRPRVQRLLHLRRIGERHILATLALAGVGQVVDAEHDILARHDDRLAVGWAQDVVGRHHQHPRLQLRLRRERYVDRHLVAVEIRVERGAHERMELDRLALDQHRFEGLDAEAVQGRRPVEQNGMLADHLLEDVPHLRPFLLDQALGRLQRRRHGIELELRIDERLEELERHLLRQAALMQLELRADDDHRPARIIDALAEQVLPEAALLALQHVAQRFQRSFVGARHHPPAAAVVEQRIHRFLEHALLVADDDLGRAELDQPLQAVVPIDHATVKIIEIGGGEAAAVERHQGAELRRDHRHDLEDHPFRPVAGEDEGFDQLQPLHELLALRLGIGLLQLVAQRIALALEIEGLQHGPDRLRADSGGEGVGTVIVLSLAELLLGEELVFLEGRQAWLRDDVALEIENPLHFLERHVEQEPDAGRHGFQEPDMSDRRRQLDMSHALAPDLGLDHFDAAFLADDPAILHALVLAAQALVVLDRPENARTEQPVALRFERPVVDRLRLPDLAIRPGSDFLRARNRDLDLVELLRGADRTEEIDQLAHRGILRTRRVAGWRHPTGRRRTRFSLLF